MKRTLTSGLAAVLITATLHAQQQVTFVTHGYQLDPFDIDGFLEESEAPAAPQWVLDMEDAIAADFSHANPRSFSWNARSGNWGSGWAVAAGEHLAALVWDEVAAGAEHVHLIGHSRGAGVLSEATRRLGAAGVGKGFCLDGTQIHVTYLDPVDAQDHEEGCAYPNNLALESVQNLSDPMIRTYANVDRADTYHRNTCNVDLFPIGTPIDGSADVDLGLVGHSFPHQWYLPTISPSSTDGYHWSLAAGGYGSFPSAQGYSYPIPDATDIAWVTNGDFEERAPGGATLLAVWTGYRWEEPLGAQSWAYRDGVGAGVSLVPRPGAFDNWCARFEVGPQLTASLSHQPILLPPTANELELAIRVDGVPTGVERLVVRFAGNSILDTAIAPYATGLFETLQVDVQSLAGSTGELEFIYEGNGSPVDLYLDDIAVDVTPTGGMVVRAGCQELNPEGSLQHLAGCPRVGGTFTVGVHNPLGTQAPGSIALVLASAPALPCGLAFPGWGMLSPGAFGELLIDLGTYFGAFFGGAWDGDPEPITLGLPNNPNMVGVDFLLQGMLFDPTALPGTEPGLTRGLVVTIGA